MNMDEANMMDDMRDEIVDLKVKIEELESDLETAQERIDEIIGRANDLVRDAYAEGFTDASPSYSEASGWNSSSSRSSLSELR